MAVPMKSAKDYILIDVSPEEIHHAAYEPNTRLVIDAAFNKLKRSIEQYGLQYPPLVSRRAQGDGFDCIEGHRRLGVLKAMNCERIPVMVTSGDAAALFRDICATTKKVTANQWIEIYLKGGQLQGGATKTAITQLDRLMGRGFLEQLLANNMSPTIWGTARKFVTYTKVEEQQLREVLQWLLTNRAVRDVAAWIAGGSPITELLMAFRENRKPTLFREAAD